MSTSPKRTSPDRARPRGLALEAIEPRLLLAADSADAADAAAGLADALPELSVAPPAASALEVLATSVATTAATSSYSYTGAGQTVVIIDSGIAWDHTALGGEIGAGFHIVGGWDFAENDADPYDDGPMGTHGTHVAGIIGSLDPRYPGLAPGADIVALRVFDDQGQGDFPRIEAALRWVHENLNSFVHPITTVNLSLGARWNAEGAPEWSIIEDELAQLEADGVFIAVAAGNSFARYDQQVGLAYPAASQYVVPVASVDADGHLSSFSQRSDRVLAAPGRNVTSTVPDYAGNFNYRADDFLSLSGTSMAAPYVAAASMLVREALAAAGRPRVTQDDIYAVLRDTADVVYDTITGQNYRRVNVERALESIVVVPAPTPDPPPADPQPSPAPRNPPTSTPTPTIVDWGRVDSAVFAGESLSGRAWRELTAANEGILTIEFVGAASNASARLFDAAGTLLAIAAPTGGTLRLDAEVVAGQSYRVEIDSAGGVDVRVTNLVHRDGLAVYVFGTAGDDAISFVAGTMHSTTVHVLAVNGTRYTFDVPAVRRVYLLGGDGDDAVTLVGTNNVDAAALRPGKVSLRTSSVLVLARGFETAAIDGRGGRDAAYFADSQADERFTSRGDRAELAGSSSRLVASGFESVRVRSFGGQDTATLYVDAADERVLRNGASTMLLGANVLRELTGFAAVAMFAAAAASPLEQSIAVSAASRVAAPAAFHADVFSSFAAAVDTKPTAAGRAAIDVDAAAALLRSARETLRKPPIEAAAMARLVGPEGGISGRADVAWDRLSAANRPVAKSAHGNGSGETARVEAVDAVMASDDIGPENAGSE